MVKLIVVEIITEVEQRHYFIGHPRVVLAAKIFLQLDLGHPVIMGLHVHQIFFLADTADGFESFLDAWLQLGPFPLGTEILIRVNLDLPDFLDGLGLRVIRNLVVFEVAVIFLSVFVHSRESAGLGQV